MTTLALPLVIALAATPVDYGRDVQPLLARHCFTCHGPDASTRAADLRLDDRDSAIAGAIIPGNAAASPLIERISTHDAGDRMPPDGRVALSRDEIAVIAQWIDEGAPYARHWSWEPLREDAPPEGPAAHPVDRFIEARLGRYDLDPAPPAEPAARLRRLSIDLTGLPPTPDEVDAFLADDDPGAWERVVDRLLDSPQYGERWARHWLDLMRYAETHGHEFDYPIRHAWRYRDYVIRALNADVPYDEFVTEHIAGDLLAQPRRHPDRGTNESAVATGFWFLSQGTHGPVDVRGDEAERIANQIDVFSKAFVGVTVSCARCHDHKFDAISTADFYALSGFLQSSRRDVRYLDPNGTIEAGQSELLELRRAIDAAWDTPAPPSRALAGELDAASAAITALNGIEGDDAARKAAEDAIVAEHAAAADMSEERLRTVIDAERRRPQRRLDAEGPDFEAFDDDWRDRWFASGHAFAGEDSETTEGPDHEAVIAAPGTADSARLARRLQGTLRSPTFTIDSSHIEYLVRGRAGRIRLIIDGFYLDEFNALLFEGFSFGVDHDDWRVRRQNVGRYRGHRAYIELIDDGEGYIAVDSIRFTDQPHDAQESFGDGRAVVDALTTAAARQVAGTADRNDVALLNWAIEDGLVRRSDSPRLRELVDRATSIAGNLPRPERALALTDGTQEDERVFIRGNHRELGELAERRFIESLAPDQVPIGEGSGRLELARRLFDPSNPLPPRVAVNRVWLHLFGEGIVATPDDFGALGLPPSHPALLDWLARWYRDDADWSTKALVRLLVTSDAYQRGWNGTPSSTDPGNSLLAHARVRRLEAEAIRDSMLLVAGRLDPRMEGPSVEVHLTPFMTGRGRPGRSGPLDGDGRRSIYIAVRRNFLSPMMTAFDAPVPAETIGRRHRSNVPAQALMLLNDPFVEQQALRWAQRMMREHDAVNERIDAMYRHAFARPVTDDERADVVAFLQAQADERSAAWRSDEATWADLAHVLFNAKEFLVR